MPVIKAYDPSQVVVTFNGVEIKGFADGTFVEVLTDVQGREYTEKAFSSLKCGDVVFSAFYNRIWQDVGPYTVTSVTHNYVYGRLIGQDEDDVLLGSSKDNTSCRVRTTTKSSQNASQWNGKCPKCRRGTYTGLVNVEHEGGRCDK